MRGSALIVIGAVAACLAAAPAAQARHGLGPFGVLTLPFRALIGFPHGFYRHHHHVEHARAEHAHHPPASATTGEPSSVAPAPAALALWPNLDPEIYDELVGYALWPHEDAHRFWTHGADDILDAIVGPPSARRNRVAARRGEARVAIAGETTGTAATAPGGEAAADRGMCGQRARDLATRPLDLVARRLRLTDPQQVALDGLRRALVEEIERRSADCPAAPPATAVARLKAMKAALWLVRNLGIFIRGPLRDFYDSLSGDQQAVLRADGPAAASGGRPAAPAGRQHSAAAICSAESAKWPAEAIEQSLEPSDEQRASLARLSATYDAVGKDLKASCPPSSPMAPLERLDAADSRLLSLASATMTLNGALMNFYGQLTDDQKQRFNLLRR